MKYIPVIVDKKGNIKNLKKHSFLVVEITLIKNIKKIKKIGGCKIKCKFYLPSQGIRLLFPIRLSIRKKHFLNNSELLSVQMSNGIKMIKEEAFRGCIRLKKIIFSSEIRKIGRGAFLGCSSLESVELPNRINVIESCVFKDCTSLKSVDIPDSVCLIRKSAFENCSSLISVTFPCNIIAIGEDAFSNCTSLTSVKLEGRKPPTLDPYAFDGATSLKNIYVPIESLDDYRKAKVWSDYNIQPI